MPDLSGTGLTTGYPYSVTFHDWGGRPRASLINGNSDTTTVLFTALRTAMGNASNARVTATRQTVQAEQLNIGAAQNFTYDEAYPNVKTALVLIFQNTLGVKESVVVPAPDASLFLADGETPVEPDAAGTAGEILMDAIIVAALAVLNAGPPASLYSYSRGYLEGVGKRVRTPLPIQEPGAQPPGDAPGV